MGKCVAKACGGAEKERVGVTDDGTTVGEAHVCSLPVLPLSLFLPPPSSSSPPNNDEGLTWQWALLC